MFLVWFLLINLIRIKILFYINFNIFTEFLFWTAVELNEQYFLQDEQKWSTS
jgi:hypothetical protein